ncbi:MAG: hypothetical protein QXU09_02280 [Thermoproteota archaeon]
MGLTNDTKVFVEREKYLEIIGFTSYAYITGKITKYSGMAGGRTRTLGEFIENFIYGKIAEEAFKLFLINKFGLQTLTEVDIADFYRGVYLPDVVAIKKGNDFIPLKFWIDVKEVRRDQKWMLIPASSVRTRPYDAYVAVWVGLPDEHIIWIVKNVPGVKEKMSKDWLKKVNEVARNIEVIPCKILGFVTWRDASAVEKMKNIELNKKGGCYFDGKTPLFDPENPFQKRGRVGENIGFALKILEQNSDWNELVSLIKINKKIIPEIPMPKTKSGRLSKKSGLPDNFITFSDYREAFQAFFEEQLNEIRKKFGKINRSESWFAQPL